MNQITEDRGLGNAETPQVFVPRAVAEILGFWPPPSGSETAFETAGGPLHVWVVPGYVVLRLLLERLSRLRLWWIL